MRLSEIQTVEKKKKTFFVDKEKLSSLWGLISKAYNLREEITPGCEHCEDGRVKKIAKTGFGYTTSICECTQVAEQINKMMIELESAGMSPEIVDKYFLEGYNSGMYSFDELVQLLNKGKWLYMFGDVGTGKTYSAIICLYLALCSGYSIQYTNVPVLLDKLRPQEQKDESLMQALCEVDFLILDDIGQEKVSSWVLERLYIIINERYIRDKMTVITSNCDLVKLQEKIGHQAIVSRIKGSSSPVYFIGKDKR